MILHMKDEMINFINNNRVSVLSISLLNGYPHGSTVHFAFDEKTFSFIFMTSPDYEKVQPIKENGETLGSLVVGLSEEDKKTAQFNGKVNLTEDQNLISVYFKKFPEKKDVSDGEVFLAFKPDKWKYTDWNKPEGKTMLKNTGEIVVFEN